VSFGGGVVALFEFLRAGYIILLIAGGPAYLFLQVWSLRRLAAAWRYAALLPLLLGVGLLGTAIDGPAHGGPGVSTILALALAAAVYLLGLIGLERLVRRLAVGTRAATGA
jgi:hypothetical protein